MKTKKTILREVSSFRDPSGYVYYSGTGVYRRVNPIYQKSYRLFIQSGLKDRLVSDQRLLNFQELKTSDRQTGTLTLKTYKLPFISYPYEWSFNQLKDAALLTLSIQKSAMEYGLSLKDASAYNVQFIDGKPILIDLLSFEEYVDGQPWIAYRQFCQHFLGPLLLMAKTDIRLGSLLRTYLDGLPLDTVSRLLPKSSYLNTSILSHIHFHARNQQKYASYQSENSLRPQKLSKALLLGIINNLEDAINSLTIKIHTQWGNYYEVTNYSKKAFDHKKKIVVDWQKQLKPKIVWDLGANTGEFSRLFSRCGIFTLSLDSDPLAVDLNYRQVKSQKESCLLPLVMDLTNPSPNQGWNWQERKSLIGRGPANLVMALALIHHLCFSYNLPFEQVAAFLKGIGKNLIIEFVPKTDTKVRQLLSRRPDIFPWYDEPTFEKIFSGFFRIEKKVPIGFCSRRTMYLMRVRT
jgi:ribosomal protein L11 methylase PrmA